MGQLKIIPMGRHPETGALGYSHYVNEDPDKVLYYTGPKAMGAFMLGDGTVYNVSDHAIQVETLEHAYELDHLLAKSYEESGALDSDPDPVSGEVRKFVHPPCAYCTPADAYQGQQAALAAAAAENASLNGLAGTGNTNVMPFVSLHTATPGTTGASENAASGSYTRQSATWAGASAGSIATSNSQTFSTAGSTAVTYAGTNSASGTSGGTYAIGCALTAGVTSASIVFATGALAFTSS